MGGAKATTIPLNVLIAIFYDHSTEVETNGTYIAQWDEIRQGDAIEWNRLKRAVVGPDFSITDNYAEAVQQLDIDNFIDDTMLNVDTALND